MGADACSLVVCHGCCCAREHGRRSPAAQQRLAHLRAAVRPLGVAVTVSDCLGPCERRDVVVVRPSRSGRAHGGRPVWLGWADDRVSEAVQAWVRVGGPGHALLPALLELHQFAAPAPVGR